MQHIIPRPQAKVVLDSSNAEQVARFQISTRIVYGFPWPLLGETEIDCLAMALRAARIKEINAVEDALFFVATHMPEVHEEAHMLLAYLNLLRCYFKDQMEPSYWIKQEDDHIADHLLAMESYLSELAI